MEHVESYRDRHFRAWTQKDGLAWKGFLALDGTLESGIGCEHKEEAHVLKAAIEAARSRLDAMHPAGATTIA